MGKENEYPQQKFEKKWIYAPITPMIIGWTESFGKYLCAYNESNPTKKALTTGQLRKFFGEVKRIDADVIKHREDLIMLKPLLAYAVGRDKKKLGKDFINKTRIDDFADEITKAIDAVLDGNNLKEDFKKFVKILEAIVAYHKRYGGQENSSN